MNDPALTALQKEIAEIGLLLWEKGWAERNAGNISVNITGLFDAPFCGDAQASVMFGRPYPALANALILISGTQTRMRHVAKNPAATTCLLQISPAADSAHIHNAENSALRPSSEFPAHLAIHEMQALRKDDSKVVIHTHPDELIALSHIPHFKDEATLNNMLWAMHPETAVVLPEGVGFVPYTTPGTDALADATVKTMTNHRVALWEKHGVVATGRSLDEAFDCIDTVAKSVSIFMKCRSIGYEPEGLTAQQLMELREAFGV